nr:MAG: hypothetical protein EDM05_28295 [Leptolyngbya sp. IPPAS B-1204]
MVDTLERKENNTQSSILTNSEIRQKYSNRVEINHRHNVASDYTEKIQELDKSFNYSDNCPYYWGEPHLSLLYGTPLYEVASPDQKLALNHLYWAAVYYLTAANEIAATLYNEVTASVLFPLGYETLCHELDFETNQERHHIHAFHHIGNSTEMALLGQIILHDILRQVYKSNGILGRVPLRQLVHKFFAAHWSVSPFLATQFFTMRYIANILLQNKESQYSKYYRDLERRGEFTPIPTAVSRYHLLDEAFHMTTSQFLSQDLPKDFPPPSTYERTILNTQVYLLQQNSLYGISGAIPGGFVGDKPGAMPMVYKLLQSPLFGMSSEETFDWMEKIFCHEHEGFHNTLRFHKRALADLRNALEKDEYLWPVNREMRVMAAAGSIEKAIAANKKALKTFAASVSS